MVRVKLICVGKLKESFYKQAAAEYEKRLKGYCLPEILELAEERLPDAPSQAEIDAGATYLSLMEKNLETLKSCM